MVAYASASPLRHLLIPTDVKMAKRPSKTTPVTFSDPTMDILGINPPAWTLLTEFKPSRSSTAIRALIETDSLPRVAVVNTNTQPQLIPPTEPAPTRTRQSLLLT